MDVRFQKVYKDVRTLHGPHTTINGLGHQFSGPFRFRQVRTGIGTAADLGHRGRIDEAMPLGSCRRLRSSNKLEIRLEVSLPIFRAVLILASIVIAKLFGGRVGRPTPSIPARRGCAS